MRADYDLVLVDWKDKPQSLLDANPMGKVPTIVHNGSTISETAGICAYLAVTFPEMGLAPRNDEYADYFRWLFFAAGPVEQAVTSKALGLEPGDEHRGMIGFGSFEKVIDTLTHKFSRDAYVCGDRFTMADVYVGAQVDWGIRSGGMPEHKSFKAYAERLRARDAYHRAEVIGDALIADMQAS